MKKASATLALCLLLLAGSLHPAAANSKSGESKEQKDRRDKVDDLCKEPPENTPAPTMMPSPPPGMCYCTPATSSPGTGSGVSPTPAGFQSHCILVEAFLNMSVLLTVQEQVIWEAWIVEIEDTILADVSLTLDEQVVAISLSLKAFLSVNINIYNVLCYEEISDWGFLIDFLYVDIDIEIVLVPAIVALDSNNQCELTQAITNASANSSPSDQAACQQLVAEIQVILEESVSFEVQMGLLYQCFQAWFAQNPSLESFVLSIQIQGFGVIQSLVDVCKVYEQIVTISEVISGSTTSDCVLLAALQSASKNSSFTAAQQAQILQLEAKIQVFFSSTTNYSMRLEYVSFTCYQMFLLEPWMIEIVESIWCAEWGSIYDIIFCSGICTNYGCGDLGSEVTTKAPTTTKKPTTTRPTSTKKPTTTMAPHNCGTIPSLIVVSSTNTTILTSTLLTHYNTWTASQKSGFNTYFNDIRNAIWKNTLYPTVNKKLEFIRQSLYQYNNNSVVNQQLVFNITITVWQGTIAQFVSCCGNY